MNEDGSLSPAKIIQLMAGMFLSFNLILIFVVVFLESDLIESKENVIINRLVITTQYDNKN